jgi:hypothetical protein
VGIHQEKWYMKKAGERQEARGDRIKVKGN